MEAKLIEYAYPTSTTAQKSGHYMDGCWFVSLYKDQNSHEKVRVLKYFDGNARGKEQAERFADSLPNPYNWMHRYHNQ